MKRVIRSVLTVLLLCSYWGVGCPVISQLTLMYSEGVGDLALCGDLTCVGDLIGSGDLSLWGDLIGSGDFASGDLASGETTLGEAITFSLDTTLRMVKVKEASCFPAGFSTSRV